ncbi:transglutaminase family protein [Limibaculum sp. M0105]|uniref:Transglutaminase family protein n=1 Tax=Thermohalobaculum xanthum TaxID=2753746 RepID=A0A8J7M9B5_9RHOB|nr:transglutaminase family protein [Thermohalobaculum xanthum]MBK0401089.1 transglutaminase family protein [Thermohalobaculum xanthum]
MIYDVTHRTVYDYVESAAFSQHLLRLTPRDTNGQRVLSSRISLDPRPDEIVLERDMFGNLAHAATVSRPHGRFEIVAISRVERQSPSAFIFEASSPWEDVRAIATGAAAGPVPDDVAPFAFPTALTTANEEIEDWARDCFAPGRPVLAAAAALSARIHAEFDYVPGATAADTLPAESFAARRGVCQDFAHVMLAALRARRLPARYVSGYLRTIPPAGQPRLAGADASHAWVAVWDPALDWVEFDPTNNMIPGEDHITLAWGRDYSDVSPVSGIVVGAGAQSLHVGVDVMPAGG